MSPDFTTKFGVPTILILCALLYGYWLILGGKCLQASDRPWTFVFYRCAAGAAVCWISYFSIPSLRTVNGKPFSIKSTKRKDIPRFVGLGVCVAVIGVSHVGAFQEVPPITIAIFQANLSVVTAIVGKLMGVEQGSLLKVAAVLCAAGGAVLVVLSGRHGTGPENGRYVVGIPLCITALLGESLQQVINKPLMETYPPAFTIACAWFLAALPLLIVALAVDIYQRAAWGLDGSWVAWGGIAYSAILVAFVFDSSLGWCNKHSSPTTVTCFQTLQPVFAAALLWITEGEIITWGQAGGGIIIMVGLFFMIQARAQETTAPEKDGDNAVETDSLLHNEGHRKCDVEKGPADSLLRNEGPRKGDVEKGPAKDKDASHPKAKDAPKNAHHLDAEESFEAGPTYSTMPSSNTQSSKQ